MQPLRSPSALGHVEECPLAMLQVMSPFSFIHVTISKHQSAITVPVHITAAGPNLLIKMHTRSRVKLVCVAVAAWALCLLLAAALNMPAAIWCCVGTGVLVHLLLLFLLLLLLLLVAIPAS